MNENLENVYTEVHNRWNVLAKEYDTVLKMWHDELNKEDPNYIICETCSKKCSEISARREELIVIFEIIRDSI